MVKRRMGVVGNIGGGENYVEMMGRRIGLGRRIWQRNVREEGKEGIKKEKK